MGVLFVFVDGLGYGTGDPGRNPVAAPGLTFLAPLLAHPDGPPVPGSARPVSFAGVAGFAGAADACLGVPGLPQSATGQTTLLTGENASAYVGRHVKAYPTGKLRLLLEERNFLTLGARAGRRVTFLNMFRPDSLPLVLSGERRPSATTVAALAAGLRLRTLEDLIRGEAVYHDVTCWTLQGQSYVVPSVTPGEAARHALDVAARHDLCLYEYFLTDVAGHARDPELVGPVLANLDAFLGSVVAGLGLPRAGPDDVELTLVLASDHGNIEDLSTAGHTRNLVPVLAFGRSARSVVEGVASITQLAGRVAGLAGIPAPEEAPSVRPDA